jgi:hypothetical protein
MMKLNRQQSEFYIDFDEEDPPSDAKLSKKGKLEIADSSRNDQPSSFSILSIHRSLISSFLNFLYILQRSWPTPFAGSNPTSPLSTTKNPGWIRRHWSRKWLSSRKKLLNERL